MEHTPDICAENLAALLLASEAGTNHGAMKHSVTKGEPA
jgi:hypothetical protein